MLEILHEVIANLSEIIKGDIHSKYIDYEKPYVSRVWFQYGAYRVYLHKIESCNEGEAYFHPHPWKSAVRIIKGKYLMGVGHSETNEPPVIDCKSIYTSGSEYEMIEPNGWHYVAPIETTYSIMVTGELYGDREMPIVPKKDMRELNDNEILDILSICK